MEDTRGTTSEASMSPMNCKLSNDRESDQESEEKETEMTCNVLCSLMQADNECSAEAKRNCLKQFQLPMFLSKTYHMIERCDKDIATWSEAGDNFVVKDLDQFSSSVLPRYFKHSNFSSFARQLNFYGFRKLRSDPILTSEADPQTSSYVRFYHENFQRDKPELLHQIKRATKSEQGSKDEVETLKMQVATLKEMIQSQAHEYDRRLAELAYDCNRRISAMHVEVDNLATLLGHDKRNLLKSLSQVAAVSLNSYSKPNEEPPKKKQK